jgi:uncharacterized protein involved in exopolysaccharide biosynthesis
MRDSFDAFDFLDYLRRHWRLAAAACGAAVLIAASVSLLLPKRYTAAVTIMIEPPGNTDMRAATAVSPVYLESLRSFERFAASDSLFARAVERFRLQDAERQPSIEALKKRILRVAKLRDTRILEMRATLHEPKLAHDFISFLAEQTVALSRSESVAADAELIEQNRRQVTEAQERLDRARKAALEDAALDTPEVLSNSAQATLVLLTNLRRDLVDAESEVAEYAARAQAPEPGPVSDGGRRLQAARARAALLKQRVQEAEQALPRTTASLARRTGRRDEVQSELKSAQAAFEAAAARLREVQGSAGSRAERLRIIDPGIVPQRPSSPNLMLNVVAALVLAAVASLVWLSVRFAYRERELPRLRSSASRAGFSA